MVIEDDKINSDGYTLLTNLSDEDIDLSGWRIKARIGRVACKFPEGTFIEANGSLYIYAKNVHEETGENSIVWKTREQTMGDDTDILELFDANGKVVQRYSTA